MEEYIDIGIPERLSTEDHGDYIEITRRWLSGKTALLTAFVIIWDSLLFNWYDKALQTQSLMAIAFPLLHVAVGLGFTYYVIASWCNKTRILISKDRLAVRYGPVPWRGNIEIDRHHIKQLYAKENVKRNEGTMFSSTFEVRLITTDGRNKPFVGMLDNSEQALYIEQTIEKFLGIAHQAVKGEIR